MRWGQSSLGELILLGNVVNLAVVTRDGHVETTIANKRRVFMSGELEVDGERSRRGLA